MKKNMRKIGDRSGIGFSIGEGKTEKRGKDKNKESEVDKINQKIQREADILMSNRSMFGRDDILERID